MVRRGLVVTLALALLGGCGTAPPVRRGTLPPPVHNSNLGPGDRFALVVYGEEKLPKEYVVGSDGMVEIPYVGRLKAAGLDPPALQLAIKNALIEKKILRDPTVLVDVKEINSQRITIDGAVAKQGDIPYTRGLTLLRAIGSAGGFTATANKSNVLVTRTLAGGDQKTVSFSVSEIAENRAPDVELQAGDRIHVYEAFF